MYCNGFSQTEEFQVKKVCLVIHENLFRALQSSFRRVQVDHAVSTKVCIVWLMGLIYEHFLQPPANTPIFWF